MRALHAVFVLAFCAVALAVTPSPISTGSCTAVGTGTCSLTLASTAANNLLLCFCAVYKDNSRPTVPAPTVTGPGSYSGSFTLDGTAVGSNDYGSTLSHLTLPSGFVGGTVSITITPTVSASMRCVCEAWDNCWENNFASVDASTDPPQLTMTISGTQMIHVAGGGGTTTTSVPTVNPASGWVGTTSTSSVSTSPSVSMARPSTAYSVGSSNPNPPSFM